MEETGAGVEARLRAEVEERLRAAVRGGDFAEARRLVAEYGGRLAGAPAPASEREGRRGLQEWRDLLEWARRMVLSERAHACHQVRRLTAARRYCERPARRGAPPWEG